MPAPSSEIDISPALVAALVEQQHPQYAGEVRLVAHGWDNDIFRLGDLHCVRLPRRAAGAPLILNEQRWLPGIAARMPVRVPAPLAVGRPTDDYPWSWSIVEWAAGTPADLLPDRDGLATDLAAAFRALHVPAPEGAPYNSYRGVPLADRREVVLQRLDGTDADAASVAVVRAAWEAGLAAPVWDGPPLWLHGDPHPGNAIVGADGHLSALIDFGDLCSGDPATDLAAAWLFFGPAGRAAFREALADSYDGATWVRARAWAGSLALALLTDSDGSQRMASIARHTMQQLAE